MVVTVDGAVDRGDGNIRLPSVHTSACQKKMQSRVGQVTLTRRGHGARRCKVGFIDRGDQAQSGSPR